MLFKQETVALSFLSLELSLLLKVEYIFSPVNVFFNRNFPLIVH